MKVFQKKSHRFTDLVRKSVRSAADGDGGIPASAFEIAPVLFEKIIIRADSFKLGPAFGAYGYRIDVVDLGMAQGQQKRRVSRYDKLASVIADAVLDEIFQLNLICGRRGCSRVRQEDRESRDRKSVV